MVEKKSYALRVLWERARFVDVPMESREELAAAEDAVHQALTQQKSFVRITYYGELHCNISLQGFMAALEIEQPVEDSKEQRYVH